MNKELGYFSRVLANTIYKEARYWTIGQRRAIALRKQILQETIQKHIRLTGTRNSNRTKVIID